MGDLQPPLRTEDGHVAFASDAFVPSLQRTIVATLCGARLPPQLLQSCTPYGRRTYRVVFFRAFSLFILVFCFASRSHFVQLVFLGKLSLFTDVGKYGAALKGKREDTPRRVQPIVKPETTFYSDQPLQLGFYPNNAMLEAAFNQVRYCHVRPFLLMLYPISTTERIALIESRCSLPPPLAHSTR